MGTGDLFRKGVAGLGLSLDEPVLQRLDTYLAELLKWNRRVNLVADAPMAELVERHFLDSLTLLPFIDPCPEPGLVDIGSGAGFPALVLKIARPDIRVTMVEPRGKRATFLRQVVRILGLPGAQVAEARLEKASPEFSGWRGTIPLFTSRAFTATAPFLELCRPYLLPGGRVLCMKGRKAEEELAEWRRTSPDDAFTMTRSLSLTLPFSGSPRKILEFTFTGHS